MQPTIYGYTNITPQIPPTYMEKALNKQITAVLFSV